jgi:hypothetical protein
MNKRIHKGMIGALALAMATSVGPFAFAKGPSGNMNLRLNGYEVIGGVQVSTLLIGQMIVGTNGDFAGSATLTATDAAAVPPTDVCAMTISGGIITPPVGGFGSPDGLFTISVPMTTSSGGAFCSDNNNSTPATPVTLALSCTRTLVHKNLVKDLNAGQYHCVVTGISNASSITGQSMEGHLDIVSGSNSPNG